MTNTWIKASQINDYVMETNLVEGKNRLTHHYKYFGYIEGKPVIERIEGGQYRLITHYENFRFYRDCYPDDQFECQLKEFSDDTERYLEILRQLFHGKARSSGCDKYIIINFLKGSLTINELAAKTSTKPSEIKKHLYTDDKYKSYLEYAMKIRKRSTMEGVVQYIKKYNVFHDEAEQRLLEGIIGLFPKLDLSKNDWDKITFILGNNKLAFSLLSPDNQILLLQEIKLSNMNILSDYFRKRCNQLIGDYPPSPDDHFQPVIQ
ncbi:hypothetical protein [Virgibacillus ihumii]|uniref:hypothetical protein n=1 Tax=Virgibacillus ihumii TaxID=2686091 RepID=UPI00157CA9E4|nr:hypothetical protein [Virgibacillus ihumii]